MEFHDACLYVLCVCLALCGKENWTGLLAKNWEKEGRKKSQRKSEKIIVPKNNTESSEEEGEKKEWV